MISMLAMNGSSQLPERSMRKPDTTGLTIAAKAEPVFIIPLAVPDCWGAISIGMAHIGPIVISAKKKPADRHSADTVSVCSHNNGISESTLNTIRIDTILQRARV